MKYKIFSFVFSLIVVFVLSVPIISIALTETTEQQAAHQMLGTGKNPDGTTATQEQLQNAYEIYYGGYYNVVTGNTSSDKSSESSNNGVDVPSSLQGPCTGEIAISKKAAQDCAIKAQTQATLLGYTATCQVDTISMPGTGMEYVLGVKESYSPVCTINGTPGHGAYLLAGFEAPLGSNALVQHINPGWGILATELSRGGNATRANANNYINFSNTSGKTQQKSTTSSGSSAQSANSTTAYINNLLNIVRSMIETSKSASQKIANQSTTNQNMTNTNNTISDAAVSFPATIIVNADLLNIRVAPNTQARVINQYQKGATFTAGNITEGEDVEGSNKWWTIIFGTMPAYVWSGATSVVH